MPEFKSEIRKSIAGLNLSAADEEGIVEELCQHLEERFEEAVSHGASEEQAKQLVDGHDVELWQRDRKIAIFERQPE